MARLASLWPLLLVASFDIASADVARFRVEGERLFYTTRIPYPDDPSTGIIKRDVSEMGAYLMDAPDVSIVVLDSDGGKSAAAREMGDKIAALGLATEVRNSCDSACPFIFLGGSPRTLATGGTLGFHRGYVAAIEIKDFVEFRNEKLGKTLNPSEEAYDQAISGMLQELTHMKRNGVSDQFLLEVIAIPPREIWRPSRAELVAAGIINAD